MTRREILIEAKELVENGWIQHRLTDGQGNYCAAGAIEHSACYTSQSTLEIIDFMCDLVGGPLSAYNDAPGRTKDEILALFDRAIAESK